MKKGTNEELRDVYNKLVTSYDKVNSVITFSQDTKWRYQLIKELSKYCKEPKFILDIGSGKGELSKIAKIFYKNANFVLLDYAENMLSNSIVEGDKIIASFNNLPFRENAFDAVISSYAIHASDDMNQTIKEIYRVTKKALGITAIGRSNNILFSNLVKIYLKCLLQYLVILAHGDPNHYKYIYYIYTKVPSNKELKRIFGTYTDIKIFKEKALGSIYLFVGIKKSN